MHTPRPHTTNYLAATVAAVLGLLFASQADAATLDQVRLSWQRDPTTTMTVMWRTDAAITPVVQYGQTEQYGREATGTSQPAVLDGYQYHTVEITGLTPATTYHYRVAGLGDTWSEDFTFRTAPNGPMDFTFTIFGDNGSSTASGQNALRVQALAAQQQPALHLVAGDLTYADKERCDASEHCVERSWEQWFTEMQQITARVPTMTAIGNHETHQKVRFDSGELFYTRSLALPPDRGELSYSFDYGDVHFVILDSTRAGDFRPGRPQYQFVEQDLNANRKRFTVVVFHHVAYTSGHTHNADERIQQELTPLLERFNVDLVISGHNHHYERTYPLRYRQPDDPTITSTGDAYTGEDGIVYVITGGGGRSIYRFQGAQPGWSAVRCECHEVVRVDVDDAGVLTVTAIGLDGTAVDRFTITKTADGAPAAPSTPSTASPSSAEIATSPESTPSRREAPAAGAPRNDGGGSPSSTSSQTIRGVNIGGWWHDAFASADMRQSLDRLATTGANEAALAPFWYQDTKTSTTIYRRESKTPTDDSVRAAIRYAKSRGLRVALKPMVDSRDGAWRGHLEPNDVNAWFQSYEQFLLTFARIATEERVDRLIIGTELATMTRPTHTGRWRSLIAKVREIYRSSLTYAANWGERHEGEYYHIEFWDALDAIGIDAYFPLSAADRPTIAEVEAAWRATTKGGREVRWFDDIRQLHERFGKPVIFTEIGYLSCERAGEKPWEYPCRRAVSPETQANLYEGTLRFWANVPWMLGYHFWRWDTNPNAGGPTNGDYTPQGKLAEEVLRRYWTLPLPGSSNQLPAASTLPTGGAPTGAAPPGSSGAFTTGSGSSGSAVRPTAPSGLWVGSPNGIGQRSLVKLACPPSSALDHPCRVVYWVGSDGKRYAFPNEAVYRTWYADFATIRIVDAEALAAIPLNGLVTHRPGVRLVKLPSSPRVYAVDRRATLRWITSEATARALFGAAWNQHVIDLPEWLFTRYRIGAPVERASDFNPVTVRSAAPEIGAEVG
jgi:UDP-2,3-diacylglucosamine pyrophosphatase LpxH